MTEPKFIPKPGQVDYTNIRYCPVVNAVVVHDGKILLVQRNAEMKLYPSYWHCIAGFLDDHGSIEDKVLEELREEVGLNSKNIVAMHRGTIMLQEAPEYKKTFLIVPILVEVNSEKFKLNWESQSAKWFTLAQIKKINLVPGFDKVLGQFSFKR